jgi:lipoprotein-releasing system ATP-binding protein
MIIAKEIEKSYGTLKVLKGVNVEINTGEVVSIVGKSGAGKSTLLHILGGLDLPDKGLVEIESRDICDLSPNELAKFRNEKIGFVFQFHHLLPEFTAFENICIPAYIGGSSIEKTTPYAFELLSYLGLIERKDHKPSQLSGGEQQRIAVARALINKPSVVFADEPSGNLDSVSSKELHQLIFNLRKDFNQTFVIVTHNQDLAEMSDRCLTMEDGKIKEVK